MQSLNNREENEDDEEDEEVEEESTVYQNDRWLVSFGYSDVFCVFWGSYFCFPDRGKILSNNIYS